MALCNWSDPGDDYPLRFSLRAPISAGKPRIPRMPMLRPPSVPLHVPPPEVSSARTISVVGAGSSVVSGCRPSAVASGCCEIISGASAAVVGSGDEGLRPLVAARMAVAMGPRTAVVTTGSDAATVAVGTMGFDVTVASGAGVAIGVAPVVDGAGVAVGTTVAAGRGDGDGSGTDVMVTTGADAGVGVGDGTGVGVAAGEGVRGVAGVGVGVGVAVGTAVAAGVGVGVSAGTGVGAGVGVGVGVAVGTAVAAGIGVGVSAGTGVGAGDEERIVRVPSTPAKIWLPSSPNTVGNNPSVTNGNIESPAECRSTVKLSSGPDMSAAGPESSAQPRRTPSSIIDVVSDEFIASAPENCSMHESPDIEIDSSCSSLSCKLSAGSPNPECTTVTSAVSPTFARTITSGSNVSAPPAPSASLPAPGASITATIATMMMTGSAIRISGRQRTTCPSPRRSPSCPCLACRTAGRRLLRSRC